MSRICTVFLLGILCAPAFAQSSDTAPTPTFRVSTDHVLIPVIVTGKHGEPVDGLKAGDFKVLDEGKPRSIAGLNVEYGLQPLVNTSRHAETVDDPVHAPGASAAPQHISPRFTVFYFDDLRLDFTQMKYAKDAVRSVLDTALAMNGYVAIVSAIGPQNSGLTRKREVLEQTLASIRPRTMSRPRDTICPHIDFITANLIINQLDLPAFESAKNADRVDCHMDTAPESVVEGEVRSAAMQALIAGNQELHTTYTSLSAFARKMAKLPGRRVIVVVSPGFSPIDPSIRSDETAFIDLAIQSDVVVNAIDARGVYTNNLGAADDTHGATGQALVELEQSHREALSQDGSGLGDVASGTGGTFFRNSNDLTAGLRALSQPPEILYQLEISLNGIRPNGAYHHLKVEVDRKDVHVRARDGYFATKPSK